MMMYQIVQVLEQVRGKKLITTSVLSGVGTGQTVALWEGASSVTDSETLGNAPITVTATSVVFTRDIMPSAENLYDIGSAATRWEDIYGDQVYGRDFYVDEYIYHNGDTNNNIRFQASRMTLQSKASGSAKVDLHDNGNLYLNSGGGTTLTLNTSQDATFAGIVETNKIFVAKGQNVSHTVSSIKISQENTTKSQIRFYGADTSTAGILEFIGSSSDASAGGVRLTIDNSGNVGIGTTSPYAFDTTATKLHVKNAGSSGSPSEVARFEGSSDADGSGGTIRLGTSNDRGMYFEGGRTGSVPYGKIGTTEYDGTKTLAITLDNTGNVGIGTDSPGAKLDVVVSNVSTTPNPESSAVFRRNGNNYITILSNSSNEGGILFGNSTDDNDASISYGHNTQAMSFATADAERMRINSTGAIKFNNYDSTNNTGTPTYLLGTDASGNVVKTLSTPSPITSQAASLYDLIPNGAFTTTYAFTSTAGTYAEVMSGDDVITETGTYTVQMLVNDFAVGGTQYDEKYSGVMTWHATSTNDDGGGAISEIVLHRAGHAANQGMVYLRTRETTSADNNELKLEIMCNRTYSAASNVIFKFVRLI